MRFEHDGMVLWHGTPDAPAPTGPVAARSGSNQATVTIVVAVQPPSVSNTVQVIYRVNKGTPVSVSAVPQRQDLVKKVQYFAAKLPALQVGDKVDYVAVARAPGRQTPAPTDAANFSSSLHVVAAEQKAGKADAYAGAGEGAPVRSPSASAKAGAPPAHPASSSSSSPAVTSASATRASSTSQPSSEALPEDVVTMPKDQLLALAQLAGSTVEDIQKSHPDLGKQLVAKIAAQRKSAVLERFTGSSPALTSALEKLDYSQPKAAGATFEDKLIAALSAQKADKALIDEAKRTIAHFGRTWDLLDDTDFTTPIAQEPLLQPELDQAALYKLTDCAKLAASKAQRLVTAAGSPAMVDDDALQAWVASGMITAAEGGQVGLAVSLYNLVGGDADLAVAIKNKVSALPDIVRLSAEDWEQAILSAKAEPPAGLDAASFAAALRRTAANIYPTEALHARTVPGDTRALTQALSAVAPLVSKNPKLLSQDFDDVDTTSIDPEHLPEIRNAHQQLQKLIRQHPGLALEELLQGDTAPADKVAALTARLSILQKLRDLNPDHEFMGLDYSEGSADQQGLKTDGLSAAEVKMAIADLKAAQRVHAVTKDVEHTGAVLGAGYGSACAVAIGHPEDFRQRTGLPKAVAEEHHSKAKAILAKASNAVMSSVDVVRHPFHKTRAGHLHPGVEDYLKKIPGFSGLFGSQDYCLCTECQSILGAPAYFVDLMTFVEENVTSQVFKGKKAEDKLNLKVRRPDLWTLPLTCDNTNTLIPYLLIINQTLENYIATQRGYRGSLTDRNAVETAVYANTLVNSHSSFTQPFTFPLVRLDIYLEHFSVTRLQIARALGAASPIVQKAGLKISQAIHQQLNDTAADIGFLDQVYHGLFGLKEKDSSLAAVDIQKLLPTTGYSRTDCEQAVTTRFVTKGGAYKVRVRSEKRSPASVQNDVERIYGLNPDALHRLYRFTRLLRATSFAVVELDLILTQMAAAGLASGTHDLALARIVQVLDLQARWSLPVDQNCALWSALPQTALDPAQGSLFDRLFNSQLASNDVRLPQPNEFIHPAFLPPGTPSAADDMTPRLLAALQISDRDLINLITQLASALGSPSPSQGFALSLDNLTMLYRHVLLARLLNMGISSFFQMMQLAAIPNGAIENLDDLVSLLNFYDWYQASGYQLDDLAVITQGQPQNPAAYPQPQAIASALVNRIANSHALEFADTVFASLPGVTEQQSQQIVAANSSLIEAVPNSAAAALRLSTAFSPNATISIPDGISLAPADALTALLNYHASQLIPTNLAGLLGGDPGTMATLLAMTGANLSSASIVQALETTPTPPATSVDPSTLGPLVTLVAQIIPLNVLFSNGGSFGPGDIAFIEQNGAVFGVTNFNVLNVANIRKISVYSTFAANLTDPSPLQAALTSFSSIRFFAGADPAGLAAILGINAAQVPRLLLNVTLPPTAPEALTKLSGVAALLNTLGIGPDALKLILSDQYTDQAAACDALLAACRAQCASQQDFLDKLEPFEGRVRSRRRDALTDYILKSMGLRFETLDDLYNYFLLDVQLEECMQTSWVVAAISSVQLYVYRCLMNLEQDQRDPADPDHIEVRPGLIPLDEWEWRQHYRVFQLNREVFLYPEAFIEPENRDDKTPQFEDLESTLQQQPINGQNVLDAYATYLAAFDQLSKLQIAGSYHDIDRGSRTDVLHLFGVTPGDPPTFYYRTIENAIHGERESDRNVVYTPWTPVSVQIPGREVSPVVYLGRLYVFWTQVNTTPMNYVGSGGSTFIGYKHHWTIKYTSLRPDRTWTAPQQLAATDDKLFGLGDGIVSDPLEGGGHEQQPQQDDTSASDVLEFLTGQKALPAGWTSLTTYEAGLGPRYDTRVHPQPIDGYTLRGFQWDRVYPKSESDLVITGRNFAFTGNVDFYNQNVDSLQTKMLVRNPTHAVLCSRKEASKLSRRLYTGVQDRFWLESYPWCSIVAQDDRIEKLSQTIDSYQLVPRLKRGLYKKHIGAILGSSDIAIINNSVSDAVIDVGSDLILLQGSVRPGDYVMKRLGTTLSEHLCRTLFVSGVDGLLDIDTQAQMQESRPPLRILRNIQSKVVAGKIDFKGALGTYFREIWFHVPFLIANQLNSAQEFEAARAYYEYIYNPTADIHIPRHTQAEERERMERNSVWRFLELRNLDVPSLRQILTDPASIEAYNQDPFNPHAIARLRLSAYQKCIVMKSCGNQLDEGDSLFTEFTMESVNQATLIYGRVLEELGRRPQEVGDCGLANSKERTYAHIAPKIKNGSDFLIEMETFTHGASGAAHAQPKTKPKHAYTLDRALAHYYFSEAVSAYQRPGWRSDDDVPEVEREGATDGHAGRESSHEEGDQNADYKADWTPRAKAEKGVAHPHQWKDMHAFAKDSARGKGHPGSRHKASGKTHKGHASRFAWSVVRHFQPEFCVPPDANLLAYWERVEDRLYKIRNGMDITGAKRQLALFAPSLIPNLLGEGTAAGTPLDDILSATSGDLPPYRFSYVIDKAKQHASQVQSFGTAVLSAIEKRDAQQLEVLRVTQQQNILTMTTDMKQWDVDSAQNAVDTLNAQLATAQFRHDYFQGLVEGGLNTWETTQTVSHYAASALHLGASLLAGTGGVLFLLPQLGSPFAMKYGGQELGHSTDQWAKVLQDTANQSESISASAGLQAGFERRSDSWQHEADMATKDIAQINTQLVGANTRLKSAQRALAIHKQTIAQNQKIAEFYKARFSNVALYTWMASTMQAAYRDGYHGAYSMAKLAEYAYRFERNDYTTTLLAPSYWSANHAGLLAGETLLGDLQNMERRFIETNYRTPEITQSFSLAQIAPAALVALRETASCSFSIPELFFDLFYPGQYCRKIKAVRLTIPCVAGPYTNVAATLTLTGSKLRLQPKLGDANLLSVPPQRTVSIATSTAQNDAGVFEFSFRDERYMPFEEAGAISSWTLELPKAFRSIDYRRIPDVVLQISYTALQDGGLRQSVEQANGALVNALKSQPLARLFSLRQEFPDVLSRLQHSAANTPVTFTISANYLPFFTAGSNLQVTSAELLLITAAGQTVRDLKITFDTASLTAFSPDPNLGNLPSSDVGAAFAGGMLGDHTIAIVNGGDLAPANPQPNQAAAVDDSKLLDIMVYVQYTLS